MNKASLDISVFIFHYMNHVKHVCHSIVFIQFSIIPLLERKQIEFADPCEFVHKYFNPSSILYIVHLNHYRMVGLSKHCVLGLFAHESNVIGSMSMFTFSHAVIWALFAIVIVGFPFSAFSFVQIYSLDSFVQITRISDIPTIRSGLFSVY